MKPYSGIKKTLSLIDPDEILVDSVSSLAGTGEEFEGRLEKPIGRLPSVLFLLVMAASALYLLSRAAELQIAEGEEFFAKSEQNRFVTRPIFPPRGVVYDRFGIPLVENIFSFNAVFDRKKFIKTNARMADLIRNLEVLLGKDEQELAEAGFPVDGDMSRLPARFVVAENLSIDRVVRIASRSDSLPGIEVSETYRRWYEHPFAFAHLLGFVGRVSQDEAVRRPELSREETVGKAGIEAYYDDLLRGKGGKKIAEIDSSGRETRFSLTESPEQGRAVMLTIDSALQKKAYDILSRYTRNQLGASVIALDPRNGAVRALVSSPSFDSNKFSNALSQKEFDVVVQNPLKPLFHRAIAGEFPSGSVIKPIIGAAALQEKLIDPEKKIYDEGFITIPNPYRPGEISVFKDWKKHGWVNFYDAIAVSANVYFYLIGGGYQDQRGLGVERIQRYASSFGLGAKLGIDLFGEESGLIPDPETKVKTNPENPIWRIGDTYNISIGQGGVRVTPLQMAAATAAIANGGKLYRPRLLSRVINTTDKTVMNHDEPQLIREGMVSQETLGHVIKGMRQTVTSGTAWRLGEAPVSIAAKTGTAQAGGGLPHAWVTAFGPVDNAELAVVVMVEHAGEGSTVAVPIMRDILGWYFDPGKNAGTTTRESI